MVHSAEFLNSFLIHIKLLYLIQGQGVDLIRAVTNLVAILQRLSLWLLYGSWIRKAKTEARKIPWEATKNLDNQVFKHWIGLPIHYLCFKVWVLWHYGVRSRYHRYYATRTMWLHKKTYIKEYLEVILSITLTFRRRSFDLQKSYPTQVPLSKYDPSVLAYTLSWEQ